MSTDNDDVENAICQLHEAMCGLRQEIERSHEIIAKIRVDLRTKPPSFVCSRRHQFFDYLAWQLGEIGLNDKAVQDS